MAKSDLSIFIWGERGTGKEDLARAIHKASPRREKAFVAVDSAALDPDKLCANFFGQARKWAGTEEERGGFIEEAEGGTLYLEDVDHLTLPMQVRLRRLMQSGEYYREDSTRVRKADVRFVVSCTKDLTSPDFTQPFSRDLLYHLMVNSIRIPPLRERPKDIPLLAQHFLDVELRRSGRRLDGYTLECLALLERYTFHDNIQELRTLIAGAVANAEGRVITVDDLPFFIRDRLEKAEGGLEPERLAEITRGFVRSTFDYLSRDGERTATELGISTERLGEFLD